MSRAGLIATGVLLLILLGGYLAWPQARRLQRQRERHALSIDCENYPLLCNLSRQDYTVEMSTDGRLLLELARHYDGRRGTQPGITLAGFQTIPAKVVAWPDFESPEVWGVRAVPPELHGSSFWRSMRPKLGAQKLMHMTQYDLLDFLGPIDPDLEFSPMCLPFLQEGDELRAYACGQTFYPYREPKLELGLTKINSPLRLEPCSPELIEVKPGDYPALGREPGIKRYASGVLVEPGFPCYLLRDANLAHAEQALLFDGTYCGWPADAPLDKVCSYYLFWNPFYVQGSGNLDLPPATP